MKKVCDLMVRLQKVPFCALEHIPQAVITKVQESKKFRDYLGKMEEAEKGVQVSRVQLVHVEMFGEKVGFVTLRAYTSKDSFALPGYVFLRGPAVAILLLANNRIVVVQQYRVPVQCTLVEAPAGMLDESGDFVGVAAAEILEQTSIRLSKPMLHPLGSIYPSPGGCDEEVFLFFAQLTLSQQQIHQIQHKIHGKEGEKERIKVAFIQYHIPTVLATKDAKLIALVLAYQQRLKSAL